MIRVYSHSNPFFVYNAKNILEANYLKVELRNEFSAGAVGELPPTDNWLELWLFDDIHGELAKKLLRCLDSPSPSVDWRCKNCSDINGENFDFCWNCQQ